MGSPGLKREKKKGRGRPFQPGPDPRRLEGPRKPFIKIRQRLSVITAERLSEPAPDDLCALVRLPPGTSCARVVVEALLWEAGQGDVAAATALFEFTEAARVLQVNVFGAVSEQRMEELRAQYRQHVEQEARRLGAGAPTTIEAAS
jgi:hypothetical protein